MKPHPWTRAAASSSSLGPSPNQETLAAQHTGRDSDTSGDEEGQERTAGQIFVDQLNALYLQRKLNAKDFCTLAFLANNAGISEAAPYALNPNSQSGKFQRHLNGVLPYLQARDRLYEIEVPSYNAAELSRGTHHMYTLAPHEVLNDPADPALQAKLEQMISERSLPPCYFDHRVVLETQGPVLPLSLFVDGVPYSESDSCVGFWLINELDGSRHLLAAVRKSLACECGCKGWDTFYGVFQFLAWSFKCLARRRYPECRHDGARWGRADSYRKELSGRELPFAGCLLNIKGDWAELSGTFGFPGWNDALRPCFLCCAPPSKLFQTSGFSPVSLPWRQNEAGDYEAACRRCEIKVTVTANWHQRLVRLVEYDKRTDGSRGLALKAPVPELGLRAGDRVEPCAELPDVAAFKEIQDFPRTIVFWRRSAETLCRRRNPIFTADLDTLPHRSLSVDALHALNLGVMNSFCREVVWAMLEKGVWGQRDTMDETWQIASLTIRAELREWYRDRQRRFPDENLTRITTFSRKKLGDPSRRKLRTKAAETWGFLLYILDRAEKETEMREDSDWRRTLRAGRALERMVETWRKAGSVLTSAELQVTMDCWKSFLSLTAERESLQIPKRHLCAHLVFRAAYFGNPRRYANWEDESLNRVLKAALRQVSQATFEAFLLLRFREVLRQRGVKRPL